MQIKILSWNVWYQADLSQVNDFLENFDADVIGLQEVMRTDGKLLLSEKFMNKFGKNYVFTPSLPPKWALKHEGKSVEVGVAIFSKFPIFKSTIHNLSETDNRTAIQADVQLPDKELHIFCTHLLHTHQKPSYVQDEQAKNLVKVIPQDNVILMGDFNALPESNTIEIMNEALENTDPKKLPTWSVYPNGCPGGCDLPGVIYKLDNIFISKDLKTRSFKVENSKASDHLPISAVVEI